MSEIFIVNAFGFFAPASTLLPLQILFLNIVTDVFPALALGVGVIRKSEHENYHYSKINFMSGEILTKEDLQSFRIQLLNDIKALLLINQSAKIEWLRSSEIRKALKISAGTLQNLRVTGKLKPAKIGGILFYRNSDLEKLLDSGNQN